MTKPLPPLRKRAWGYLGVGHWAPPRKRDGVAHGTAVVGVCARCRCVRAADDLMLYRRPFTDTEAWVCRGGC